MNNLTQTPNSAPSAPTSTATLDQMFTPIIGANTPDVHEIAWAARQSFAQHQTNVVPVPTPPTATELRAILHELAPVVRAQLWEVEQFETNYNLPGVDERNGLRVQSPPLFAHFALVALALTELETA